MSLRVIATTTCIFVLAACATKPAVVEEQEPQEQSVIVETQSVGKLRKEAIDLNKDKSPDIWNYYSLDGRRKLVRKDSDINFDGKVDVISHYEGGQLVREEVDADFDTKFDWFDYFEDGSRVRQESDTSFDGVIDVWKYFEDGQIMRKERDLNGDGRPEFFEYYESGKVERIGRDTTGDGKLDTWE